MKKVWKFQPTKTLTFCRTTPTVQYNIFKLLQKSFVWVGNNARAQTVADVEILLRKAVTTWLTDLVGSRKIFSYTMTTSTKSLFDPKKVKARNQLCLWHMSKCLSWSLGHAEQLLFSCLCSKDTIYKWKWQSFFSWEPAQWTQNSQEMMRRSKKHCIFRL